MEKLPTCHIVLATDSPVPVLAPLLEVGAKEALLIYTAHTAPFAVRQAEVLKKRGINVQMEALEDAFHLGPILQAASRLAQRHEQGVCVNLTGGSKLMSIAFYQVFNRRQDHLYYVHLHHNGIVWLNRQKPDMLIKTPLSISELLACRGYEIDEYKTAHDYPEKWCELAYGFCRGEHRVGLGVLTKEIYRGANTLRPSVGVAPFFEILKEARLLTSIGDDYAKPVDPQRRFLTSEWLELGVYEIIRRLSQRHAAISEVLMGVKVYNPENPLVDSVSGNVQPLQNELDVVAVCNNTLYLIECKNTSKVNQGMASKLDAIRDTIGDIKAKAMLLSSGELEGITRRRAKEYGIDLLEWENFDRLEEHLIEWMGLDRKVSCV